MRYHFTPTRMPIIKKRRVSVGEDVEKLEPWHLAGKNVYHAVSVETVWQFLKK